MGFLDNLIKKEARKIISSTVDSVVDNAMDAFGVKGRNTEVSSNTVTYPTGDVGKNNNSNEYGGEAGVRARIRMIAAQEYPYWQIRENIPASEMGAESGARDYSMGLYENGQPKALFMMISNSNHYRRSDVMKAQHACRQKGVAYMNFMTYFPNREDYIRDRFKKQITL